jgi:hypothetical protein
MMVQLTIEVASWGISLYGIMVKLEVEFCVLYPCRVCEAVHVPANVCRIEPLRRKCALLRFLLLLF